MMSIDDDDDDIDMRCIDDQCAMRMYSSCRAGACANTLRS